MKSWIFGSILALCFASTVGCGAMSAPTQTTLAKDSLLAVQTLGLFAKGVEDLADAKVITVKEAHQVLNPTKDVVKTIKAGNQNTVALVQQLLDDINKMPFASKLQGLLFTAKLGMGLIKPAVAEMPPVEGIVNLVMMFLPSLMGFITKRRAETGQDPTLEEIKAHVASEADDVIADIDNWETLNPIPTDPS